jgi:ribosome recycling factor
MNYKEFIDKAKPDFEKALKFLMGELDKLRTSRATPSMVEDIQVTVFGNTFSLNQLASISCPEPSQIVIQPWDPSYIEGIEKAIHNSGLGMSAAVDKNLIRLTLPTLTEEYRKSLVKVLNQKAEEGRQTMRHAREEAWNKIQKAEKEGAISEDDKFRAKDDLQKVVDDYNQRVKELVERKEKDLM